MAILAPEAKGLFGTLVRELVLPAVAGVLGGAIVLTFEKSSRPQGCEHDYPEVKAPQSPHRCPRINCPYCKGSTGQAGALK